jgi:hypothetical protein
MPTDPQDRALVTVLAGAARGEKGYSSFPALEERKEMNIPFRSSRVLDSAAARYNDRDPGGAASTVVTIESVLTKLRETIAMSLRIPCPSCRAWLTIPENLSGKQMGCPD